MMAKAIVPVTIVALIAVDKNPQKIVKELTPEEVEQASQCIKQLFFKGDVKIAVYPKAVPLEKVETAIKEFLMLINPEK